ncbi:MAG TPA: tetratricopeptide repeat protein [Micropepsaceae bacterium]|jgi:predicted O-linked N-acetylglucosamine transferase (SPINDLY family)|nr:tetratricopeptide repeat protein [Micropepsaceae bacterium]
MSEILLQNAQRMHKAGNLAEAARLYGEVLRLNPRQFDALYALGFLHYQGAKYGEAERLIGEALRINPGVAEAHFIRGCSLHRLGRIEDALAAFDRAVAHKPNFVEALMNRGAAFMALNRHNEALKDFRGVIAINPHIAGVWSNCGGILQNLNRHEEALACFDKALAINPDLIEALANRAAALLALKRFGDAARAFETLLSLHPELPDVHGHLVFCRLQRCDWGHLTQDRADIAAALSAGKPVIQPLINTRLWTSPADQLQCARIFVRRWPPSPNPLWRGEPYHHSKIRVAYISADFCDHATSWLAAGLFEQHDRTRFETMAISLFADDGSEMRARTRAAFDAFIDAERKSDAEIAGFLRQIEVDIAIDLMGFAAGCRPGILAFRPASVQVNYLGYPGTMGASYVDYILADKIVIPDGHRSYYDEKVAILPDTYQCNDSKRRIAEKTPSRAEAGLPREGFVFCCFNDPSKIAPEIFEVWMRLLRDVDGSVLWLLENNPEATRNLRREAEARAVDGDRLIFAPLMKLAEHLARHRLADLFLDTLPYGAHTTASDSLWAGVPVLTCMGASFAGRVAASLLHAVGMPELIAHSLEDYAALALKLARDPTGLTALRTKLARHRDTYPLFDTARFARNFEAALATMHRRRENGEPPADFAVT